MKIKHVLTSMAAALILGFDAQAQVLETFSFNPNLSIPDGNAAGISDTRTVATTTTAITSLDVTLNLAGDFNGDLYLYLRHETGFSVLLNRAGRESGKPFGYADSGFNIRLSDAAPHNVHTYRDQTSPGAGLQLSGTWQPDGRNIDPATVLATDISTTPLSSFNGLNPNGEWTLFAADLVNGGTSQINSWGLVVTAVPEPQTLALAWAASLAGYGIFRRLRRK